MRQSETRPSSVGISSTLAVVLACALSGCASRFAGDSEHALISDLVTIREWDGHTGFNTPEGRRSYGWEAEDVLVARGPQSVPALADALRDPSLNARQRSLLRRTLGEIGPEASLAVPAMVEGLRAADPGTAVAICRELARIGPGAGAAVPELQRVLRERGKEITSPTMTFGDVVMPEARLRMRIAHTLGAIGPPAESALPSLTRGALQTQDLEYRRACRTAMRRILGPEPGACRR